MIHKCNCHSPYQDERYGKGMRVFNRLGRGREGKAKGVGRCTVCGYMLPKSSGYTPKGEVNVV